MIVIKSSLIDESKIKKEKANRSTILTLFRLMIMIWNERVASAVVLVTKKDAFFGMSKKILDWRTNGTNVSSR
jgi:hypothetical protein